MRSGSNITGNTTSTSKLSHSKRPLIHAHSHVWVDDPRHSHSPSTPASTVPPLPQPTHYTVHHEFPPPPPPPAPSSAPSAPVTPNNASFTHSPTHTTSPAPPATVLFSKPPIRESWRSTDTHWDANVLHGHQLFRTIESNPWS